MAVGLGIWKEFCQLNQTYLEKNEMKEVPMVHAIDLAQHNIE
jgi:hypothetical protein